MPKPQIRISVWSDYVCPFCYLELPILDRLQAEMGDDLEIEWQAFELRPEPVPTLDPDGDYLHRVWNASVYPMAAERGMTLSLPPVQPRSRLALEAAAFARDEGHFDVMHRRLFRAFFEEGRDIGDVQVLLDIGQMADIDTDGLAQALADGTYTEAVQADQAMARQLNITGVPALLIHAGHTAYLLSGAQPYDQLKTAIIRATEGASK